MVNIANLRKVNLIHKELSYKIVGILFEVFNELGYGYQEKYYERAIEKYLIGYRINYRNQCPYKLTANNQVIGRYYMDFIIENKIVLEIKKGAYYPKRNIEQVRGYLQATNLKLAILANFTPQGVKYIRVLNPNNIN